MKCQWQEFIQILPQWLRPLVDESGRSDMTELRLRVGKPPEIVKGSYSEFLKRNIVNEDLNYILNTATRYSPWTSPSVKEGYITAAGGHRIGLCGEYVYMEGDVKNIRCLSSLCIRIARQITNVSGGVHKKSGSILIIGRPGSGKTTFLRDLIYQTSSHQKGSVVVIDERRELFPGSFGKFCFDTGDRTDILSGCYKVNGLEIAVRTLNPSVIAVDEITGDTDCLALSKAAWCGVRLFATAHAGSKKELFSRNIYKPILENKIFDTLIILQADKTWREEALDE